MTAQTLIPASSSTSSTAATNMNTAPADLAANNVITAMDGHDEFLLVRGNIAYQGKRKQNNGDSQPQSKIKITDATASTSTAANRFQILDMDVENEQNSAPVDAAKKAPKPPPFVLSDVLDLNRLIREIIKVIEIDLSST